MPEPTTHPSPEELNSFSLGQLASDVAAAIENHISECQPCCETLLGLSTDDTFVELLQEAKQLPTDQTAAQVGASLRERSIPDVPKPLAEHPRYEVLELIGKGGMGDVYKARHRMMDRTVALKIINRELMRKTEAVDRFHREVKTAASLSHPNIVTAHDAEQAGDVHFLVMEFVDGVDLARTVKECSPLPVGQACDYIQQAARGLQYAHERGMVHRDIKPHNLMVTAVTDSGTLVIESSDENVEIAVRPLTHESHEGNKHSMAMQYRIGDTVTGSTVKRLRSGAYIVDLKGRENEYELSQDRFILKRGGKVIVKVTRRDDSEVPSGDTAPRVVNVAPSKPNEITLVDSLRGHSAAGVGRHCLAASADGKFLLSCGGPVALYWDIANRRLVRMLTGPTTNVAVVALSPDGKHAAGVTTQGEAYLWSLETGKPTYLNKVGNKNSAGIAFSPDSSLLVTGSNQGHAFAWNVQTGEELARQNTVEFWWDCLVMPDNETVAIALGSLVKFWNLKTGNVETKVKYSRAVNCTSVAMSADGSTLLVGTKWFEGAVEQDKGVHVWNTAEWREVQRCDGPTAAVTSVAFLSGERHIIAGGKDGRIFIWDLETGREVARKEGLGEFANAVIPLADGRHAVSFGKWHADEANDPTAGAFAIRLWRLPESVASQIENIRTGTAHKNLVQWFELSRDGKRLFTASAGEITVRAAETFVVEQTIHTEPQRTRTLAISPDGSLVANGGQDGHLEVWDWKAGKQSSDADLGKGAIEYMEWSPDGRTVLLKCVSSGGYLEWNIEQQQLDRTWESSGQAFTFSVDGRWLAAGERRSGSVKLFDVTTGKLAKSLEHHTRRDRVRALAFSPDSRFVLSGADDGLAKLWNVETGELLRTFKHGNNVHAGVFLPDGEHFLTSSKEGRSVVLWNIDSDQGVPVANDAETSEKGLELFPDGGKFITSHACFQLPAGPPRPGVIQLWRIPPNALVQDGRP